MRVGVRVMVGVAVFVGVLVGVGVRVLVEVAVAVGGTTEAQLENSEVLFDGEVAVPVMD